MDDPIPAYHTRLDELSAELAARGSFGILVFDLSFVGEIELEYGTTAYAEVRERIRALIRDQRGKDFRNDDVLSLDEPKGAWLILFLDRKRRKDLPVLNADLLAARQRLGKSFAHNLGRAAFPYCKTPPPIPIGQGIVLHNPLVNAKRAIQSALESARAIASHERTSARLEARQRLEDLIAGQRIVTAYQPIMRIAERETVAVEALSRGARGTGLEAADLLFGAATRHNMLIELDRLCRSRALLSSARIPSKAMLFVNTLPATIRDPQFRGKPLIDFLDKAQVAPDRIVIEITEKLVIENYGLFLESMAYFSELRMRFAVDDVGSGYSGLEAISRLKPDFLKIDMSLVRNVHESAVNREMVKAIIALGHGIGAEVIAEGIETQDEADALVELGTDYGQGYLLARPEIAAEASP